MIQHTTCERVMLIALSSERYEAKRTVLHNFYLLSLISSKIASKWFTLFFKN